MSFLLSPHCSEENMLLKLHCILDCGHVPLFKLRELYILEFHDVLGKVLLQKNLFEDFQIDHFILS